MYVQWIPPETVGPLKGPIEAFEEVNNHDSVSNHEQAYRAVHYPDTNELCIDTSLPLHLFQSQNIAVPAAYAAAIGPALCTVVGIGLPSSATINEPKNKKKGKDRRTPRKEKCGDKWDLATRVCPWA